MHCIILTNSKHWNLKVIKREKNVGAFFGFESEDGENSDKIKNEKKVLFSVHMDMGEERVHCQPMTSWPGKKHPSSFSNLYSIFFFILSWILNIFVWFILCYYWRIHWEQFGMYGVLTLPIKKLVEGFLIIVFFFFFKCLRNLIIVLMHWKEQNLQVMDSLFHKVFMKQYGGEESYYLYTYICTMQ